MADEIEPAAGGDVPQSKIPQPQTAVDRLGPEQVIAPAQFDEEHSIWGFKGRITRSEFWIRMGAVLAGSVIACIPSMLMFLLVPSEGNVVAPSAGNVVARSEGIVVAILAGIFVLAILTCFVFAWWLSLATQVKRWHDVNLSGWMVLLNCVPYLGIIPFIILGCLKGTKGNNRYGIDPLAEARVPPEHNVVLAGCPIFAPGAPSSARSYRARVGYRSR